MYSLIVRAWLVLVMLCSYTTVQSSTTSESLQKPMITTRWVGEQETYTLSGWHLDQKPLFSLFNKNYFMNHQLPKTPIFYRNSTYKSVLGLTLDRLANDCVQELQEGKKKFKHFIVLKDKEYNYSECAGLIVLKFKNHPFVLKLFLENPISFLQPYKKGFSHGCMSLISGGVNRYLVGFTRIKNLEHTKKLLLNNQEFAHLVDFPRKWFWQPENNKWFELKGMYLSSTKLKAKLPAIYGIIADEIVTDKSVAFVRKQYKDLVFAMCQATQFTIDPNIKNFRIERKTGKLVLIDTEHFISMLGFKEIKASNRPSLHLQIGMKCIHDFYFS
jgi:hypothetical protein